MHGPVKPPSLSPAEAPAAERRTPAGTDPAEVPAARDGAHDGDEREQLRDALHMVLNVNVYDCAGRAVTVKDMLRGSLATMVRVALNGKRTG
jgi:hypothetical protein